MKSMIRYLVPVMLAASVSCVSSTSANNRQLTHVLLFKWKPEVTDARIMVLGDLWKDLNTEIGGFEQYELYRVQSGGYDHVVVLGFDSETAYHEYVNHERHLKIAELGKDMVDQFYSYSYWK
ncbi:MAG: Dabb family protein [Cyclobacteriaceae bacterium]